jgi:hypothetical protein
MMKSSMVAAGMAVLSLALLAGCKTPKPEPTAAPVTPPPAVINEKPTPSPVAKMGDSGDNMATNILALDATRKEYHAKPGEMSAPFTFSITNVSSAPLTIYTTETTCECTVAKLPSTPWVLASGSGGTLDASINLSNKVQTVTNSVVVFTSKGNRRLNLIVYLPESNSK